MSKVKSAWPFPVLLLATAVIFVACIPPESGSPSVRSSGKPTAPISVVSSIDVTSDADNPTHVRVDKHVTATVTFSENVRVTGAPSLKFTIGTDHTKTFTGQPTYYQGLTGTTPADNRSANVRRAVFAYVVASTDGGKVTVPAAALSATITDAAGNVTAYVTTPPRAGEKNSGAGSGSVTVDNTRPSVSDAFITPYQGATVKKDKLVSIRVNLDEAVKVTGTPYIDLTSLLDGDEPTAKRANYRWTSSDGRQLLFQYKVAAHHAGILTIPNTATITIGAGASIKDLAGNNLNPGLNTELRGPTVGPVRVENVFEQEHKPDPLGVGDELTFVLTPSELARVENAELHLKIGGKTPVNPQTVKYFDSDGKEVLDPTASPPAVAKFTVTFIVAPGENGKVSVPPGAFTGTLTDLAGNQSIFVSGTPDPAADEQSSPAATGDPIFVDTPPVVKLETTTISGNGQTLDTGNIDVTVNFSEEVSVAGTPQIKLTGFVRDGRAVDKYAEYNAAASTTTTLVFRYIVGEGDNSSGAVKLANGAVIELPSGATIKDVGDYKKSYISAAVTDADLSGPIVDTALG